MEISIDLMEINSPYAQWIYSFGYRIYYFIVFASELSNARISGFANTFARSSGSTSSATVVLLFSCWFLRFPVTLELYNIFFWHFFILFSLKYERKIIPSYNETLRACFTVVKSKFFEISAFFLKFSKESGCLYIVSTFEKWKNFHFWKWVTI